ncbi:MAG: FMN-binding protein [Deltaproteobacteria bacterium]|nr:FMN-binding protein [Deltaproteobacteria bacterium]NND29273.1 FMN-binding protein [Myxococcales bacterium]MBT8463543.1 FMN-binding protein [Deltaproteobacteria bacterium]MBT8480884.1 FMN-binding protein [Deltaproteobacteria bacterium]NNK08735.1 FMN-binding protein [Myxococcales bacterium]
MKSVFNKAAWIFVLALFGAGLAATGRAQVYFSVRGLLAEQFRESELVDFERIELSETDREGLEKRLGQKLERGEFIFYVAHSGSRVDGYALFDREIGQHEYIDFATFFDGEGRVTRVEVVAYREPYGEGIRSKRFREQFVGRQAASGFRPGHDIDIISGATLSAHAMAKAVKRATVLLHDAVLSSS